MEEYEDLIKCLRERAKEWCYNCCHKTEGYGCLSPYYYCDSAAMFEAADVLEKLSKERKKGKWDVIPMIDGFAHYTLLKCSECGGLSDYPTNFCRDCGADMRDCMNNNENS